uniref:Uncharacterized protein n=1 Tax=Panagrolaimus davidi TaxID=227884 RepID=A0A914PTC1_9BILA
MKCHLCLLLNKIIDIKQFCKNRVGVVAFAYRYHALENKEDNDKTCLDINEQIYCHEYLIKNNMVNPYPLEITPAYQNGCPGFGNATFNEFDINKTQTVTVMIPQDLEIFKKENRTIVHVQELFIKCPKCTPDQTKPAKSGNTDCTRTIKTIEKGWPWFAENCKEGEVVECPATKSSTTLDPLSEGTTTLATGTPQNMFNLLNEQQEEMMIKDDF